MVVIKRLRTSTVLTITNNIHIHIHIIITTTTTIIIIESSSSNHHQLYIYVCINVLFPNIFPYKWAINAIMPSSNYPMLSQGPDPTFLSRIAGLRLPGLQVRRWWDCVTSTPEEIADLLLFSRPIWPKLYKSPLENGSNFCTCGSPSSSGGTRSWIIGATSAYIYIYTYILR